MLAARGFGSAALRIADRVDRMLYSSVDLVDAGIIPPIPHVPGFWFHALDPHLDTAALWEGVRQPVLLAWGELDCQVPANDSRAVLTVALRRSGNPEVTTVVLPGADHSFTLVPPCGNETGLAHHGGHTLADGYLQLAPTWIQQLGTDASTLPPPDATATHDQGVLGWHLDAPAPAPWYGSIAAQFVTVVLLLGLFTATARRSRPEAVRHGVAAGRARVATGVAGIVATLTVLAAFTEIAMLGDTHAAFLIGGPAVESNSILMQTSRAAVAATTLGALVTSGLELRARRAGGGKKIAVVAISTVLLLVWVAYWGLAPLA